MNRDIKFRAWDKREKRMGEVNYIKYSNVQYTQVSARFKQKGKTVDEWFAYGSEDGSDNIILMQYTGLHDKNCKEIYEFDKCEVYRTCVYAKGFITSHQGCFIFKEFDTGNVLRLCDLKINRYEIKVTGTVFNNPELIKEASK